MTTNASMVALTTAQFPKPLTAQEKAIQDAAERVVAAAPPLTDDQRRTITGILGER